MKLFQNIKDINDSDNQKTISLKPSDPTAITVGVDEVGRGSLASFVLACAVITLNNHTKIKGVQDSKKLNQKERLIIFNEMLNSDNHIFCISIGTEKEIEKLNILHATMKAMHNSITGITKAISQIKKKERIENIYNKYKSIYIKQITEQANKPFCEENTPYLIFASQQAIETTKKIIHSQHNNHKNAKEQNFNILIDGNNIPKGVEIPTNWSIQSIIKGDSKVYQISAASIFAKVARDMFLTEILHPEYPEYLFNKNYGYGTKKHIEAIIKHGYTEHHRKKFTLSAINKMQNLFEQRDT